MGLPREQRWHMWKNYDVTTDPTCPPYGCVEIVGWELVGTDVVFRGRSFRGFEDVVPPVYFPEYSDDQGAKRNHAFNGSSALQPQSLNPDAIGLLTFDFPTWASVDLRAKPRSISFGDVLTCGLFFNTTTQLIETVGSPWHLGYIPPEDGTYYHLDRLAGWNVYLNAPELVTINSDIYTQCLIGGLPTFLKSANRPGG